MTVAMELTFSQTGGFAQYTGTPWYESEASAHTLATEDFEKVLNHVGYHEQWAYKFGIECDGDRIEGYEQHGENLHDLPRYLTLFWDYETATCIYCDDPGDFFALRLKLLSNPQVVTPMVEAFLNLAEKAFHANHGHDFRSECQSCDPYEMARIRQRQWK